MYGGIRVITANWEADLRVTDMDGCCGGCVINDLQLEWIGKGQPKSTGLVRVKNELVKKLRAGIRADHYVVFTLTAIDPKTVRDLGEAEFSDDAGLRLTLIDIARHLKMIEVCRGVSKSSKNEIVLFAGDESLL